MSDCLLCERCDETGSYLCPGCTKATLVRLDSLPVLYAALAGLLMPGGGSAGPRVSGGRAEAPMPAAELPLTMRGPGGMVGVVEDWRSALHADRGMREPQPRGSLENRLDAAVRGLWNNMPWIAVSWPLAGAFAEEIRDLVKAAVSIVDPEEVVDRGTRAGCCPAVNADGSRCGAALRLYRGAKAITCAWCGTHYPPATWGQLKTWQDEDGKVATDVA